MPDKLTRHNKTALNWLNFFAADISDGVRPFLAVYLASNLKWNPADIGMAISATTLSMVVGQSPAGYIVDNTIKKRLPILIASLVLLGTALLLPQLRSFHVIIGCQIVMGLAASFYMPSLVALANVVSEEGDFDKTIGNNQSFNHAGNVASAVFTGVVTRLTGNSAIFYCMAVLAGCCNLSVLSISQKHISSTLETQVKESQSVSVKEVLKNKPFLMFMLLTICFYFSNGAMLPLVAQEITRAEPANSTLYLAACIIIAQLVMVPTVYVCGKLAGKGRKRLLIIAFILLATRGVLYTLTADVNLLLSFQILDGMAAGMFSVVAIMVVNDLMGTSGLASLAQGMLAASLSLGSTLSHITAGFIVHAAGFTIGFIFLSCLAIASLILLWKGMPETAKIRANHYPEICIYNRNKKA